MSNRPELRLGPGLLPGVLAIALFGLMALIALNTGFGDGAGGFDTDSVTASIGYALFDFGPLQADAGVVGTEPFLLAFLLIAVVLDAALDAALVLAKREEAGEPVSALSNIPDERPSGSAGAAATDGGRAESVANAGGADGADADRTDGSADRTNGGERA